MKTDAPELRVDEHLRLGRPRDLDAPIVEVRWRLRDAPVRIAALDRVRQEVGHLAHVEPGPAPDAVVQHALGSGLKDRCNCATKPSASGVRISSKVGGVAARDSEAWLLLSLATVALSAATIGAPNWQTVTELHDAFTPNLRGGRYPRCYRRAVGELQTLDDRECI
jgi:hypothetical protein